MTNLALITRLRDQADAYKPNAPILSALLAEAAEEIERHAAWAREYAASPEGREAITALRLSRGDL